jgi:rhodanese-related sulfurtransferase
MVTPFPPPDAAAQHFAAALAMYTDVADVHAGLHSGQFVLLDSRSGEAWTQGHIPGAIHLPTAEIPARAPRELDPARPVVTYCWGPGCNGATRAALALARLGYQVKEMIGGIEYWRREGFPVRTPVGVISAPADPLAAPTPMACGC